MQKYLNRKKANFMKTVSIRKRIWSPAMIRRRITAENKISMSKMERIEKYRKESKIQ